MRDHAIFSGAKTWKKRDPALPPSPQWRWNDSNRGALRAHAAVRQALRDGSLERGRCEVCGSFRVEAHHDRYDQPLIVRWLCRLHHRRLHAEMRRAQ